MWNTILTVFCVTSMSAFSSAVTYPNPTCYQKRFRTCPDRYAAMPGHLNCRNSYSGVSANASDEAEIVNIHNHLRASVRPIAGNMMSLEYTTGLHNTAQRWTRLCSTESSWFERASPGAYIHGQNTYRSPTKVQWKDVLNVCIAENASFTYNGSANNKDRVGNYTQMISAPTTKLGCAVSDCHGYYLYMCLYAPILKPANINTPYNESKRTCGDCPANCNRTANLCNCNGVTCLGGSRLNLTTCVCDCINTMGDPGMYNGTLCELTCNDIHGDDPACGSPPYENVTCDTNMDTMFHCPYMCFACPYSEAMYRSGDELLPWEKGLPNCSSTTSAGIPMTLQSMTTRINSNQSPPSASTTDFLNNSACGVMQNIALSMGFLALVFTLT